MQNITHAGSGVSGPDNQYATDILGRLDFHSGAFRFWTLFDFWPSGSGLRARFGSKTYFGQDFLLILPGFVSRSSKATLKISKTNRWSHISKLNRKRIPKKSANVFLLSLGGPALLALTQEQYSPCNPLDKNVDFLK